MITDIKYIAIKKWQCLFCRQDASSNRLGRNEV